MTENRVQIIIDAKADGAISQISGVDGKIRVLEGSVSSVSGVGGQFAGTMQNAEKSLSSLQSRTISATSALNALTGVMGALGVTASVEKMVASATKYNEEIESSSLGFGALLSSQGRFIDQQGRTLEGEQKINAAMRTSSDLMQQLEKDNIQTAATLPQLVRAMQSSLSPGLSTGFSVDQVRQYTVAVVQAASAMRIPLDMLAEETRSMLKGTIEPRNSLIATALGIRNEDIQKYQGNARGLFDFLMNRLQAFNDFGVLTQNTYSGIMSNAADAALKALGTGTQPFFNYFKAEMKGVIDSFMTLDAQTRFIKLNPDMISDLKGVNTILVTAVESAKALAKGLADTALPAANLLGGREAPLLAGGWPGFGGYSTEGMKLDDLRKKIQETIALAQEFARIGQRGTGMDFMESLLSPLKYMDRLSEYASSGRDLNVAILSLKRLQEEAAKGGADTSALSKVVDELSKGNYNLSESTIRTALGLGDFSYQANRSVLSAEELQKSLKKLYEQFKDVENASTRLGKSLQDEITAAVAKYNALASGMDSGSAAIEVRHAKRLAEIRELEEAYRKQGMNTSQIDAYLSPKRWQAEYLFGQEKTNKSLEDAQKAAKSAGKGILNYADIDQSVNRFESRVSKMYQDINDVGYQMWIDQEKAAGNFYHADELANELWLKNRKEAIAENTRSTIQQYQEMVQKIEKAESRGKASPEALAEKARSQAEIAKIQAAAEQQANQAEQYARWKQQELNRQTELKRLEGVAQLRVEYTQLGGTLQDQLQATLQLLEAERQRRLQEAGSTAEAQKQRDLINQIYDERTRQQNLRINGTFLQGMEEEAKRIGNNLPTAFDRGTTAVQTFQQGINDASRSMARFLMTGKGDFGDMIQSWIENLIALQLQAAATNAVFGGAGGGGGGLFGWIKGLFGGGSGLGYNVAEWTGVGLGHRGGMAGSLPDSIFVPAGIFANAPRLHNGLAPDEFPAVLQSGERVLNRRETAAYNKTSTTTLQVQVNIENQTGTPVKAEQGPVRYDMEKAVVGVVLKNYNEGGSIWQMIRGEKGK